MIENKFVKAAYILFMIGLSLKLTTYLTLKMLQNSLSQVKTAKEVVSLAVLVMAVVIIIISAISYFLVL